MKRCVAFDWLRVLGIAFIIAVVHGKTYSPFYKQTVKGLFFLDLFNAPGILAGLFFASGYLLSVRYHPIGRKPVMDFISRRLTRLIPLFAISLLTLPYASPWYVKLLSFCGANNFLPGIAGHNIHTLWFVSVLLVFYLLFLLLAQFRSIWSKLLVAVFVEFLLAGGWWQWGWEPRMYRYFPAFALGVLACDVPEDRIFKVAFPFAALWFALRMWDVRFPLVAAELASGAFVLVVCWGASFLPRCGSILSVLSYASFGAYLFHRQVYWLFDHCLFPADGCGKMLMILFGALPLAFGVGWVMQKGYDVLMNWVRCGSGGVRLKADAVRLVVAACLCAILGSFAVPEVGITLRKLRKGESRMLSKLRTDVAGACVSKFPLREGLVSIHGLFVRIVGQHLCNGVAKTRHGDMLLSSSPGKVDTRPFVRKMAAFSAHCRQQDVHFLFVLLPKKLDLKGSLYPPGWHDWAYANVSTLLKGVKRRGVGVLDLRQEFAATKEDVLQNFYRTDHHWNTDASFKAAGLISSKIAVVCGISEPDQKNVRYCLSPEVWTREIVPRCYLGSQGRRVGPLFAGLDDLIVLRPAFPTEMSIEIPLEKERRFGSFEQTVMKDFSKIGLRGFYADDAYSRAYTGIGNRHPIVRYGNGCAPAKQKVLLIGDSFTRPLGGFLAVAFKDVVAVDPRRTEKGFSLARFVAQEKPDIVVQVHSTPSFSARRDADGRLIGGLAMFEYGL